MRITTEQFEKEPLLVYAVVGDGKVWYRSLRRYEADVYAGEINSRSQKTGRHVDVVEYVAWPVPVSSLTLADPAAVMPETHDASPSLRIAAGGRQS